MENITMDTAFLNQSIMSISDVIRIIGVVITIAGSVFASIYFFMKKHNAYLQDVLKEQHGMIKEQETRAKQHDDFLVKLDRKLDVITEKMETKVDREEYRGGIQRAHEEREKLGIIVQNHEERITELERPTVFGFVSSAIKSVKNAFMGNRKII